MAKKFGVNDLNFIKMHGLGNDFIMIDTFTEKNITTDLAQLARVMCNRRMGVGADGLILILPSEKADLRMRIFNSDGSEPEMCGNGIRCFAALAYEKGLIKQDNITVETLAGIIKPELALDKKGNVTGVRVDMGEPRLVPQDIPVIADGDKVINQSIEIQGENFNYTAVSMGNPHCVIFVDSLDNAQVKTIGPLIELHENFPNKVNVEFVEVLNSKEVKMRVWERGAGETMACGTGACAVGVACVLNNKTERKVTVNLLGGGLEIEWAENNHVFMTGPATKVFEGKWSLLTIEGSII